MMYDFGLMLHDVRYELSPEVRALLDAQFRGGVIAPIAALFEEGIRQGYLLDAEHGGIAPTLATSLFMNIISRFAAKVQEDISAHTRQSRQILWYVCFFTGLPTLRRASFFYLQLSA